MVYVSDANGRWVFQIDCDRINYADGPWAYRIDGHIPRRMLMALIAILYSRA